MDDTTSMVKEGADAAVAVIQEIAKQLGIATDKVGELAMTVVPQYAGMKVVDNIFFAIIGLIVVVVTAILLGKFMKWHKEYVFCDEDVKATVLVIAVIIVIAAFVIGVVLTLSGMRNAIEWGVFPFGKIFDIALTNIK